jgi:hypothetical protein
LIVTGRPPNENKNQWDAGRGSSFKSIEPEKRKFYRYIGSLKEVWLRVNWLWYNPSSTWNDVLKSASCMGLGFSHRGTQ